MVLSRVLRDRRGRLARPVLRGPRATMVPWALLGRLDQSAHKARRAPLALRVHPAHRARLVRPVATARQDRRA